MIGVAGALAGFAVMIGLMLLGVHVATTLFIIGVLGTVIYLGPYTLLGFGSMMWGTLNDFILTAIPLFVLLGEILLRAGVTERMYRALAAWLDPLPGGLLHTNIGASAVFAAVSGSSVATAATVGTVALPALRERGYSERLALGSIAAGATLGILIPPSINMIIYGAIANASVGRLFMAGVIPGILLALVFMGVIAAACLWSPSLAAVPHPRMALRAKLLLMADILPPFFVFLIVMGGIYLGWATPTEAAALGVIASVVLAAINGKLSISMLHDAFLAMTRTTAMILLILVGAFYLNFVIGLLGIPRTLTSFVSDIGASPLETILILIVFYLILGCFLETLSMMIATVPIVLPVVVHLGFDPVWFGIFLVLMMEISLFTPPIGMNLYVVQSVRGRGPITDVIYGSLPFLAAMILFVFAIIAWPQLVLWLPDRMFG